LIFWAPIWRSFKESTATWPLRSFSDALILADQSAFELKSDVLAIILPPKWPVSKVQDLKYLQYPARKPAEGNGMYAGGIQNAHQVWA